MLSQGFLDLDELILLCRNDKARSFIQEAVQCYKSGAYRQTIVAAWIAVVYDIIQKLQELELSGDANAKIHLEKFEKIRKAGDLKAALDFERNILDIAIDEFELISNIEYMDLVRLQEDRNRCAHPAMNIDDEIYQPYPELARSHLRNAVENLLQRPPVQGKAALNRLILDINSEYFPININDAVNYLSAGPLAHPRTSLIRNFVIILIKDILDIQTDVLKRERILSALLATMKIQPDISRATLVDKLKDLIAKQPDDALHLIISLLFHQRDLWNSLSEDSRTRLKNYILKLPVEEEATVLPQALHISDLQNDAEVRLKTVSYYNLAQIAIDDKNNIHPSIVRRAILAYMSSESFNEANYIGTQLIIPLAEGILPDDIGLIIKACADNQQISMSFEKNHVLHYLRDCEIIPTQDFNLLLTQNLIDIDPQPNDDF